MGRSWNGNPAVVVGTNPIQLTHAARSTQRLAIINMATDAQEELVQSMISLPKLDGVSWRVVDQATEDPKVELDLKVVDEGAAGALKFKAGRPMLTVLTDSLKRVKNDLQSVSGSQK